jgi:hypothetical protein
MGRRKKQKDIEEAISEKTNGVGHNSILTDDERRALTLHHARLYAVVDAAVEKAKSDRTAVANLAKSDLGKGALADIKDINTNDERKMKANIERALRLARWKGMPVGTTMNLFDAPVDDRAAEEGLTAGMAGEECKPPVHLTGEGVQRWIAKWHDGQAILMSAFGKKHVDKPSDTPNTTDTSNPPFNAADDERVRGGADPMELPADLDQRKKMAGADA